MADKTDVLKNEVEKILSVQGKNKICILINTDDYSGKFIKVSGEKIILLEETEYGENSGYGYLERRMAERYSLTEENISDLLDMSSEICRKLKRYIKSSRMLNPTLISEMSCQTLEDELAEVKGNLIILVGKIKQLAADKNIEEACYIIYGKMSGNYLIERYLREALSYDADLEDPLLYISSAIIDSRELFRKEVLDSIQIVLCGINEQKKKINIVCSKDREEGFFGPIYTMGTSTITVEGKDEVWNISLPFQTDDNGAELIEVKLLYVENEENVLLIKRLSSNELFDIAL